MKLNDLGCNPKIEEIIKSEQYANFEVGRVVREHKERYFVSLQDGDFEAEITGNLRFSAKSNADFPAVGDWVACVLFDNQLAIIQSILPRKSLLERQAVGKHGESQIIAANVDEGLIVQSADHNFNINRLERYMTICYSAGIDVTLVLTKLDLISKTDFDDILHQLNERGISISIFPISNVSKQGYSDLMTYMRKGKSYCVIGSSSVGKSTLINNLMGYEHLKTSATSESNLKGRHTTSHRELIVLDNGGILIDTPGMRELGITENPEALSMTFNAISELAQECKFSDCSHTNESGCAILFAVENGDIDSASYDNYMKMQREQEHFQRSVADKRKHDKEFGKMIKSVMKERKKNRF
ncbi:ribosome small subunit-dependent GTPase A [Candidatus Venteria ishoeyi]|uniref:Small ribosomal subunit biogenesis GTPase RsgA n=1 Tax=Candidatus Venteria ishoeyi TaxID=1899563 RepID=A0A1H6F864_9GAMM|nr:ribosome small subunit-dependent GTPase A [Candidatus Venteria ishoeyi]SEH05236.1 Putative ribosome biogenesis GTPase RsgA [Candidatus Venteria ishoeyi]